jgi:hypothetical protein
MPFKLNAFLPSKQQEVPIKELCYKQYRELVKSLYNADKKETIQQYNSILEDLCPDIATLDITFEDKLSLLLTIRNFCIGPDLKLKCTLADNSVFNYTVTVETLLNTVKNINKSSKVKYKDTIVSFSSYKIRDEHVFLRDNKDTFVILASHIDNIKTKNSNIDFKDLSLQDRVEVVQSLPHALIKRVVAEITKIIKLYNDINLLTVNSPVDNENILKITCNLNFDSLQKMIEFLYTENLNNIYRSLYNTVKYVGFTAEYIDSITPIELQVYWMYYMQDQANKEKADTQSGGFNLPESPNTELGF